MFLQWLKQSVALASFVGKYTIRFKMKISYLALPMSFLNNNNFYEPG